MNTLLKCVNVKKKQNIETPAATRTVPIQSKKKNVPEFRFEIVLCN